MKCKYRVRWFSSKGAGLVLLWNTLNSIVFCSLYYFIVENVHLNDTYKHLKWLLTIPVVLGFLSAPLSGWLADAKFGNYKVFRAGTVLLFMSTVLNCLFLILEELVWENNQVLKLIHLCLGNSFYAIGIFACFIPALPLGLDQMPDASSSSISSYIAWFVCSALAAGFLSKGFFLFRMCLDEATHSSYTLLWALLLVVCMSIVLASNFLFTPKWLIIEPKSPNSLKTIYRVLKFAAKHKSPINRSAFTYWEDDIPSRLDLGKSKYGGPFTTEQVEDVKTILRLLAITLSFSMLALCIDSIWSNRPLALNGFTYIVHHLFLFSSFSYSLVGVIAHEFIIYPLIRNRLPSILKRIGVASLLITLISFISFILKLAQFLSYSSEAAIEWIVRILYQLTCGIQFQYILTLILEFMCAQSPYNMRGLLLSLVTLFVIVSGGVHMISDFYFTKICTTQSWCSLVACSVQFVLLAIGFLLFCAVARWYKRRVRDEDYSPQRVVEEVYDRYLTAAAAQSRTYGARN